MSHDFSVFDSTNLSNVVLKIFHNGSYDCVNYGNKTNDAFRVAESVVHPVHDVVFDVQLTRGSDMVEASGLAMLANFEQEANSDSEANEESNFLFAFGVVEGILLSKMPVN